MTSPHARSLMSQSAHSASDKRSAASLAFEACAYEIGKPERILRRGKLDMGRFDKFKDNLAVIETNAEAGSLPFRFAGAALCKLLARADLAGVDYLSIVAPSTRASALQSACAMTTFKCGLWQLTPVRTNAGQTSYLEYTGLPIIGEGPGPGEILFLVEEHGGESAPHIIAAQSATEWQWLDLGFGVPPIG